MVIAVNRVCQTLDENGDGRVIATYISNTFDRVWYTGTLHELKGYSVSGRNFDLM